MELCVENLIRILWAHVNEYYKTYQKPLSTKRVIGMQQFLTAQAYKHTPNVIFIYILSYMAIKSFVLKKPKFQQILYYDISFFLLLNLC